MTMRNMMLCLLLGVAPGIAAQEPLVFPASALIQVDATGRVTVVEPDAALPTALQQVVRERALQWKFDPPLLEGRPVAGTTYATLRGCAVPDGDDYRIALDFKGTGPRYLTGHVPLPPQYPVDAIRSNRQTNALVTYVVGTDGNATVERIVHADLGMARYFDKTLTQWVEAMRYAPERLDGQPVRTRIETTVDFALGKMASPASMRKERQQQLQQSPECQLATQGAAEPTRSLVLDSPFRRLPPS